MRCYSVMVFSTLFFFAHLQSNVAADPQLGDMEPLYVFTPGPAPGNCDKYKSNLQIAFSEAIDMFTASTASILYLNQPMPGILHPLNRRKWKAWAQVIKEIFNIAVDTKTGLQLSDAPVQEVLGNFNTIINAHNYTAPGSGPYKYWFFCNDDWLDYKSPPTAKEIQSWDWSELTKSDISNIQKYGYWNGTAGTAAHPFHLRSVARPGDGADTGWECSRVSRGNPRAYVLQGRPVVVLCPRLFTDAPYATAAQAIKDPKFKTPGASLEQFDTWGTILSHEWGHLVLLLLDEIATDFFGNDISANGLPTLMYGFGTISQTATTHPERTRRTADTYTRYAMAVYYTGINKWGIQYVTGVGVPWKKF